MYPMTESDHDHHALRVFTEAFPDLTEKGELERAEALRAQVLRNIHRPKDLTIFDLKDDELVETDGKAYPLDG